MLEDNSDIPILSIEEIQLFVDAYYNESGLRVPSDTMHRWIYDIEPNESTVRKVLKIPYEDLPLHINDYFISQDDPAQKLWHDACIAIRLKIGK
jgi:hypothetical protein